MDVVTPVDSLEEQFKALTVDVQSQDIFPCIECGANYKKPWTLKAHMKKKHGMEEEIKKLFECSDCNVTFETKSYLQKHVKVHEKIFVCSECKEVFLKKVALNKHSKLHNICKICERIFETPYLLKRHIKSDDNYS